MEKVAHILGFKNSEKIRLSPTTLILLLTLLVGFFLRIYRISDYVIFLGDEGRDMLVVYNILHGKLTLLGPTASVGGFFLGPIYYYFITPFLFLFNYNPVGPSVMVVLFGVATILLVYKVGEEFFNKSTGIVAAILYAVSPIVVSLSRSSWNPNIVPFFSLSIIYVLYNAVTKNSSKLFFLTGLLFGIAMQLHYLVLFLGVIMFFYVLFSSIYQKNLNTIFKKYVLMFLGFIIGFAPFLLFEIRHSFTNTTNVINFIINSGDTGVGTSFYSTVGLVFTRLFGGLIASFPLSSNFYQFSPLTIKIWFVLFIALALVSISYFISVFYNNKNSFLKYSIFILWAVLGIGLFGLYKKPIYDYYLGFLFPLPFLVVGFFLSRLLNNNITKALSLLIVSVLVLVSLNFSHLRTNPNKLIDQTKTISQFVEKQAGGKPYNFALLSKSNSDSAYRYFFKLDKKDPVTIIPPQVDPERKSVTQQDFVVCENLPCAPLGNPLWEVAGFGQAKMADEWDVSVVKIYKLVHDDGK